MTDVAPLQSWVEDLLGRPGLAGQGHGQSVEDWNLGLGWIYYGLVRALRPATAVCIGSYRGFVPLVLARAQTDNLEGGTTWFIDPSLVDDFWLDPARVRAYFEGFGIGNVRHACMTTADFLASEENRAIRSVDMLFIDGYHTEEQAAFDFQAFEARLTPNAVVLLHDSIRTRTTRIYGEDRAYQHTVNRFVQRLKDDGRWQVMDVPFGDGLTLVRRSELDLSTMQKREKEDPA